MRTWWLAGVAIVGAGLGLSLWLGGWLGGRARHIEAEAMRSAEAAAARILPEIVRDWSVEALRRHASPQLLARQPPGALEDAMRELREHYGPLERLGQPEAGPAATIREEGRLLLAIETRTAATFANGSAVLRAILVEERGAWRLASFFVDDAAREPGTTVQR
jgi:hypothetical protein